MTLKQVDKIEKALLNEGFDQTVVDKIKNAIIPNLEPKTYNIAIIFLGVVTFTLAFGSIILALEKVTLPEPLWGALGAGIGGLAGLFTGTK
jgi:hypothetical protein